MRTVIGCCHLSFVGDDCSAEIAWRAKTQQLRVQLYLLLAKERDRLFNGSKGCPDICIAGGYSGFPKCTTLLNGLQQSFLLLSSFFAALYHARVD